MKEMMNDPTREHLLKAIQKMVNLTVFLLILVVLSPIYFSNKEKFNAAFADLVDLNKPTFDKSGEPRPKEEKSLFWESPEIESISDPSLKEMVAYGKELVAHTSIYLGPNGSVAQLTNGMNCQNCHLDAGTRTFGNNYGSVASTYPKFRARSGGMEDLFKRVNDCFERSLNGQPLDTNSREMLAIRSYIEFLGSNVKKGEKAPGSGLKEMAFLDRAADPIKGKEIYTAKCQSCHQANGEGTLKDGINEYLYPPLWGNASYNDAAGLYRLSNFAKYAKYNMPLGANHENPQLTDEEAWDLAAFVNSQPRPHKDVPADWPDKSNKPMDHPYGPYADSFSESQHKFGPFGPIEAERKKLEAKK